MNILTTEQLESLSYSQFRKYRKKLMEFINTAYLWDDHLKKAYIDMVNVGHTKSPDTLYTRILRVINYLKSLEINITK